MVYGSDLINALPKVTMTRHVLTRSAHSLILPTGEHKCDKQVSFRSWHCAWGLLSQPPSPEILDVHHQARLLQFSYEQTLCMLSFASGPPSAGTLGKTETNLHRDITRQLGSGRFKEGPDSISLGMFSLRLEHFFHVFYYKNKLVMLTVRNIELKNSQQQITSFCCSKFCQT